MNKNSEENFYKIIRKGNITHQVLLTRLFKNEDTVVFTLECEDLIQCKRALIAKQFNGLYSIYLPVRVSADKWDYERGFICIVENVKEYYYKSKGNKEGWLLLQVETNNSYGYWTAIQCGDFEWGLTPKRAKSSPSLTVRSRASTATVSLYFFVSFTVFIASII